MLDYDNMEVMVTPHKNSQNADYLKGLIDQHQIPIRSIHAPTLLLCQFVYGTEPVHKLKKTAELALAVGAKDVIVHPPFKANPYSKKFLKVIQNMEDETGLNFAVENMFPWAARGRTVEIYGPSYIEAAEKVNSLTLDFSHAAASGLDTLDFVKKYHHKLKVIHLTDGTTRERSKADPVLDEHLIPGDGDMPIREVYEFLRSVNWKGSTVLEINTRPQKTLSMKRYPLSHSMNFFETL